MKKRVISMLLAIVMVVGLLPTTVFAAEADAAATRVIYVDESTFFASGYSRFYDADENLLTATREEQEDGWVKYTMPADAKYYFTFDGHMGGGGGGNYPELPTNADTYDPFSDTWSCSHPGYAEGNCRLCGEPCPGHTYDNACDAECNVCSEIREVGDHVYDGAEDAECNECGYVRDITPAQITGMTVTVDGVTYTEGYVTITPESIVVFTVTGTNFTNLGENNFVIYASGYGTVLTNGWWAIDTETNTATFNATECIDQFTNCNDFQVIYSNDANDTQIGTGIYLTYDDGTGGEGQECEHSYEYDCDAYCNQCGELTRPEAEHLRNGEVCEDCHCAYGCGLGMPAVADHDWNCYFEQAPNCGYDGAYYYECTVCFTSYEEYPPATGEHEYDNACDVYCNVCSEVREVPGHVYDNDCDASCNNCDDIREVPDHVYDGDEDAECNECGYVRDITPAQITGVSITVDGVTYTEGNVTITPETESIIVTVTGTHFAKVSDDNVLDLGPGLTIFLNTWRWKIDPAANTATADFSDLNSEFGDNNGTEIMYSNDSNQNWTGTGIYLTYDDGTGGEEDTTPAEITGVSITVDGVTYTEGDVTITPTSTIVFTITGTNFANLNDNNYLGYYFSTIVSSGYGFTIDTAANTATQDFTGNISEFEQCDDFEVIYSNDGTQSWIGTGIYLTYDDGTGGEEDTTPAQITGVSITVDGVTYTEGNVTITPETESIIVTVTGTHFANVSDDNVLDLGPGLTLFLNTWRWEIDPTTNTATADFSDINSLFEDHNGIEILYSNGGGQSLTGTGIYLTYDDGTGGEEDTTPAEITGVSITVDGVTYTEGNVTITPTSTIVFTITGTNFANLNDNNYLGYSFSTIVSSGYGFTIDTAANTATQDFTGIISEFEQCDDFEVIYSNDGRQSWIGTGIYLTYDDSIGANTTLAIGDNEIADGYTYTYTAEQDGSLYITVTELYYKGIGEVNEEYLGYWCAIEINGTAITDFVNSTEVKTGDTVTVELISLDNDTYNGTVNLSWDASAMAEITDIVITGDTVVYDPDTNTYTVYFPTADEPAEYHTVFRGTNLEKYLEVTGLMWREIVERDGVEIGADFYYLNRYPDVSYHEETGELIVSATPLTTAIGMTYRYEYSNDSGATWVPALTQAFAICPHSFENGSCTICGKADGAPIITQQPTDGEAKLGERYCVEVIAQGEGLKYQWYFRNAGASNWNKSSVTDNTYDDVMTTARMNREVYCVITDSHGNTVTTDTAKLLAIKTADLAITQQPANASAKLDEMFCVTVEAQGDGLKYQWYWRTKGQENWNVSGQRDNSYDDVMTSARHNREVYCVITDAWGDSVTTEIATITGTPTTTLAITRQPESQTVTIGDMFNVTFDAVGDGLRYQWYFKNDGKDVWCKSAQKDNSYDDVMTKARHNRSLYCVVTDAWGNSVTTEPIVVIMATQKHALQILQQPGDASAKLGEEFCVTVEAQGDELKYQWYWRNAGSENWNVSGQRDNTYDDVMTKARHNREVKCVITDMWGKSVETEIALITGIPTATLAITQQPTDGEAKLGERYCVEVIAQGDGLTYQWYFRNAGSSVWCKSGVRDNTYDDVMTKARAGREVYCVITDAWGNTVTTETVTLVCS